MQESWKRLPVTKAVFTINVDYDQLKYNLGYRTPFKKKKTFSVFLSSYRNTSGGLGEREMLWEHEP